MISAISFSNYIAFYAAISITTFVFTILACVCNPKSKTFSKHKSFILSHNFPNDVSAISNSPNSVPDSQDHLTCKDDGSNKLKQISLNRALPDIPLPEDRPNISNDVFPDSSTFAPVDSVNDDVDSLYAVTNNINVEINSHNHPYARIRSNFLADSSTENDTDDYSEPRIPVTSSMQSHNVNTLNLYRPINENQNDTYELEPQPHIISIQINNNIDPVVFSTSTEPKKEISYNTISVREPLAKVLADRDNIEHHYNEVEEERVSSFYEEIITGSATYSKINEIDINNENPGEIASTSYQNSDNFHSENNRLNNLQDVPVYSIVDKKTKRVNCSDNIDLSNINNLYTRVNKPAGSHGPTSTVTNDDSNPILQRYSPPPPLPPPLNKDSQAKLYRNTIMFGMPTSNFIGLNQNYHLQHLEQANEPNEERDPGYETVYKEYQYNKIDHAESYGYEAISNDINDPAYEILELDNAYETIKNEFNHVHDNNDSQEEGDADNLNYEIIRTEARCVPGLRESTPPTNIDNLSSPSKRCHNMNEVVISSSDINDITAAIIKDDNIDIIEHL